MSVLNYYPGEIWNMKILHIKEILNIHRKSNRFCFFIKIICKIGYNIIFWEVNRFRATKRSCVTSLEAALTIWSSCSNHGHTIATRINMKFLNMASYHKLTTWLYKFTDNIRVSTFLCVDKCLFTSTILIKMWDNSSWTCVHNTLQDSVFRSISLYLLIKVF